MPKCSTLRVNGVFACLPIAVCLSISFFFSKAFGANDQSHAVELFNQGRLTEALTLFEKQIKQNDADSRAHYYAALIYIKLSKPDEARRELVETAKAAPNSLEARYAQQILNSPPYREAAAEPRVYKTAASDQEMEEAQRQAAVILKQGEDEAHVFDLKADEMAREMAAVPAVGRRASGSAYSQTAIDEATKDLRGQAQYARDRARREADDVLKRAKMREQEGLSPSQQTSPVYTTERTYTNYRPNNSGAIPYIDEINYWHQIKNMKLAGDYHDALMLKPRFRRSILSGEASVQSIKSLYSDAERSVDSSWIKAHQAMQLQFVEQSQPPIRVAGYNINSFVGYACGHFSSCFNKDGICYKVFFDFRDPARDLTPELYMQFVRTLAQKGFVGDSKICMQPGYCRFNYNDLIVHTATPEFAQLAEKVGIEIFGSRLEYLARGLDVMQTWTGRAWTNPVDWHTFLAKSTDLSRLSPSALAFVTRESK